MLSRGWIVAWGVAVATAAVLVVLGFALSSAPLVIGGAVIGLGATLVVRSRALGRFGATPGPDPEPPPEP